MFCAEEAASWTMVQNSRDGLNASLIRPSVSFADAVKQNLLTGANRVPISDHQSRRSMFDRLFFPVHPDVSKEKGKEPIGQSKQEGPECFATGQLNQARSERFAFRPNSKSGSILGQWPAAKNPMSALTPGICSRCLTAGQTREACKSSRCFACRHGGHIALNCLSGTNGKGKTVVVNSKEKEAAVEDNEKGILEQIEPSALETDLASGPR